MPLPDEVRLRHMLDAARKVVEFSRGKTQASLKNEELLTLALVRLIEIIGEAAINVSPVVKDAHPGIPWKKIAGTRNRLIHGYFDVDYDILWQIITVSIPELVTELELLLPPSP